MTLDLIDRAREAAKATGQFYAPDNRWDAVIVAILKVALPDAAAPRHDVRPGYCPTCGACPSDQIHPVADDGDDPEEEELQRAAADEDGEIDF